MKLLLFILLALPSWGQFNPFNPKAEKEETPARVIPEISSVKPGEPFTVLVEITHPDGWHSYYQNPGFIGEPLSVTWNLPEGFTAGPIQWPVPHIAEMVMLDDRVKTYGYEGAAKFLFEITPTTQVSEPVEISGSLAWQICNESSCLPKNATFSFTLPSGPAEADPAHAELFTEARAHLPKTPDGWETAATQKDNTITLAVTTGPDPIPENAFFYDADSQVDPQAPQKFIKTETGFTLSAPRNIQPEDSLIDSGPFLDRLNGIIALEGLQFPGLTVSTPLEGVLPTFGTSIPPAPKRESLLPTAEELAAGAALYDPDEKIDYVTLDGQVEKKFTFWTALIPAFLGGLILNLMPCVFPVLGIKVMGFVKQAGQNARKVRLHGLVFTLGILVSMWIVAAILLIIALTSGDPQSWGSQLGNPLVMGPLVALIFLLGLNLAGVFELGTSLTGAGSGLQSKKGFSGSFFSGVLTTLIATPCSGPFLGALMGFALVQPLPVALNIFTVFALGLASPYLLLSFFPRLIQKLPRPGAWMETFKVLMAFALFATAAFFFKTLMAQVGPDAAGWFLLALVLLSLAAWSYGRWFTPMARPLKKLLWGTAFPIVLLGLSGFMIRDAVLTAPPQKTTTYAKVGEPQWEPWFPGKIELSRSKKRIIWHDYTADW